MKTRQANKSDQSALIAELMYNAGKELYDFLHQIDNAEAIPYLEYEFKTGNGFCGYKNVTIAEVNSEIVAVGCFYDGTNYNKLMRGSLANMLKFYGPIKVWSVMKRAGHAGSLMKKPKAKEFYASNLSVPNSKRGQGIGTSFIKKQITLAKKTVMRNFLLMWRKIILGLKSYI